MTGGIEAGHKGTGLDGVPSLLNLSGWVLPMAGSLGTSFIGFKLTKPLVFLQAFSKEGIIYNLVFPLLNYNHFPVPCFRVI